MCKGCGCSAGNKSKAKKKTAKKAAKKPACGTKKK